MAHKRQVVEIAGANIFLTRVTGGNGLEKLQQQADFQSAAGYQPALQGAEKKVCS